MQTARRRLGRRKLRYNSRASFSGEVKVLYLGTKDGLPLVNDDVPLTDVASGTQCSAAIFEGFGDHHVAAIESDWMPLLKAGQQQAVLECTTDGEVDREALFELLGQRQLQDAHWDWRAKQQDLLSTWGHLAFTLEYESQVQGIVYLVHPRDCQLDSQLDQQLVYVEYLAAAPWNRKPLNGGEKRYRSVGSILIALAVSVSIDLGYGGRLGLHSLPQSYGYYANALSMTDLGYDLTKYMHYFEFDTTQAQAFLQRLNSHDDK